MAKPTKTYFTRELRLTPELRVRLADLKDSEDGFKTRFNTIEAAVQTVDGQFVAGLTYEDIDHLKHWSLRTDTGSWQDWCRDMLAYNEIDPLGMT